MNNCLFIDFISAFLYKQMNKHNQASSTIVLLNQWYIWKQDCLSTDRWLTTAMTTIVLNWNLICTLNTHCALRIDWLCKVWNAGKSHPWRNFVFVILKGRSYYLPMVVPQVKQQLFFLIINCRHCTSLLSKPTAIMPKIKISAKTKYHRTSWLW